MVVAFTLALAIVGLVFVANLAIDGDRTQPGETGLTGGEKTTAPAPDVLYALERFSGSTEDPGVVRVMDLADGTGRKLELPIGPGDPDPAMLLRGDRLVFYRGGPAPEETRVWSVGITDPLGEPQPLGHARWFLAGPGPRHVWLIEGDDADISESAELVTTDGSVLVRSSRLPEGFPVAGFADGLVLETQDGLVRWFADGTPPARLATEPARVVSYTAEVTVWVPLRDEAEIHITDMSGETTERVVRLPMSATRGSSSPDRFATALGSMAVIVDLATGATTQLELPLGGVTWVTGWSQDGSRLYLAGRSDDGPSRLWRWNGDDEPVDLRLDLGGLVELAVGV